MTWPWRADTVTRLRPAQVEDSHGNLRPNWSNPGRLVCDAVMFAPADNGDGGTVYDPQRRDIAEGDHLEWAGRRFEVIGIPQRWAPGTVVIVEGVDIPGQ